ncbi:hypothetical protein [Leeuwenhoekiella marinoflava]|uniref:hypothetical protein n=1 Tax=Leeuwenhoekiella marinoflava TaxID=988 RepID=UPI003002409C
MANYYVNNKQQENGDHEVHKSGCDYFPKDYKYLGNFSDCEDAVKEAEKEYDQVNGCYYCSNDCHTQ